MTVRIIPRLDVKGSNLVKGIHLEGLRVLGPPEHFARLYYRAGADELLYIDAVASLYGRNSLDDIIFKTSSEIFVPLCVGGGLRTLDDVSRVLRSGADKVAINTAALARPDFIGEAAEKFGSSTIVISIQASLKSGNRYQCFADAGREATGRDAVDWAREAAERGAGEILITSIDREGTCEGFDVELTRAIADSVTIPVIAGGGAGAPEHVEQVITAGHADAVSIASLFHFEALKTLDIKDPSDAGMGHLAEIKTRTPAMPGATISALKSYLAGHGAEVRTNA